MIKNDDKIIKKKQTSKRLIDGFPSRSDVKITNRTNKARTK